MVKDIAAVGDSSPDALAKLGKFVIFSASDGILPGDHGRELWRSDGTPGGTKMVKDMVTGETSSAPCGTTKLGDRVIFGAYSGADGYELWRSDGTKQGTKQVKDIVDGTDGSNPFGCD